MDKNRNLVYVITAGDTASEIFVEKVYTNKEDAKQFAKILQVTNNYVNITTTDLVSEPPAKTHTFEIDGSFDNNGKLWSYSVFDINMDMENEKFEFSHGTDKDDDWYTFAAFMNYDINESEYEFKNRVEKTICDQFKEWLKNPVDFLKEK